MIFSKCTIFVGDIETDGPNMDENSMFWFGAVRLTEALDITFEGEVRPKSDKWDPKALAVSHRTRNEVIRFDPPEIIMPRFATWVRRHTNSGTRALFCSDNNGYDWGWLNYYLWRYAGENPFGHTSCNIKNLYQGLMAGRAATGIKDSPKVRDSFKHLVKTPHDHNPVNDARGLGEAMLGMRQYGLTFPI